MNHKIKQLTIDLDDELVGVLVYFKDIEKIKTYWFSLPDTLDIDLLISDTNKIINKKKL
jgi:hypothetical protein